MIEVVYTKIKSSPDPYLWNGLVDEMPPVVQAKLERFTRWQDKQYHLLGRLLLKKALNKWGFGSDHLYKIKFTKFNKPYLELPLDFNISHSGDYVVCALSNEGDIGIDIEKIIPLSVLEYEFILTKEEKKDIIAERSSDLRKIFEIWSSKEALIKAAGIGWKIPPSDIQIQSGVAILENKQWNIAEFNFENDYVSFVCSSIYPESIVPEETFFL